LSIQGKHKTCRPYNKQLEQKNGKKGLWKIGKKNFVAIEVNRTWNKGH
jgi:hypothetical protein